MPLTDGKRYADLVTLTFDILIPNARDLENF